MARRNGLGRGLDALIPLSEEAASAGSGPTELPIDSVQPDSSQPRKHFDEMALEELADSIRQYGVIEPLIVRVHDAGYTIIAGERRYRAAKLAGLKTVPAVIRDYSDREILEISLIENLQREDLNPIEEAQAYKRLIDEFGLTQEDIASRVSKSRSAVANSIRLLSLSSDIRGLLADGSITAGHGRALLSIADESARSDVATRIASESLSVRDVEDIGRSEETAVPGVPEEEEAPAASGDYSERGTAGAARSGSRIDAVNLEYDGIAQRMAEILGTKVRISGDSAGGGRISIDFFSADDLERIVSMLEEM